MRIKTIQLVKMVMLVLTVGLSIGEVSAQNAAPPTPTPTPTATPAPNPKRIPEPADVAAPRGPNGVPIEPFATMHANFLKRGKKGPIYVLFLGDSITYGFQNCKELWPKIAKPIQAANFAMGGNGTQHVLWQIENGELDGISPKVAVLLIGTNNISAHNTPEDILKAECKIVDELHAKLPQSKVLVLGIFPRAMPYQKSVVAVNEGLARLDDGSKTRYLDIGPKLVPEAFAPDAVHINVKGYQIWADAMQPLLDEMMK